ncbi:MULTISPECIES: hypothetical protein [unclassified Sphingomonas]|uniref:hypothetical protein n=1 Tax=unclassified Sphingomonas TaxID=196159 RepID=UPI00226A6C36|nr:MULTISPECIES: hypothetical protein [unclassified Sphingomonas]
MADENPNPPAAKSSAPKKVQMHSSVHQLHTGTKPENVIEPGTIITDEVAKEHKLDKKALDALTDSGALELVDVLKG